MIENKAISYLRFSTKKQGGENRDSTRRQLALATQWCRDNGIKLDDTIKYHDLGVSAYRSKNAATGMLRAILEEVGRPAGRISPGDFLLVEAIDRLSRAKPLDSFDLIHMLVKAGLTIVTLNDGQHYSKDTLNNEPGKMYILLGAIQAAHNYSDNLRKRVEQVHQRKRDEMAEGKKTRHACPFWLTWDDVKRRYIPNEHASLVKAIFKMRTCPGVGKRTITLALKDKHTLPGNLKWEGVVSNVLSSNEVIGHRTLYRWDGDAGKLIKGEVIEDYYPAVVGIKTYELAKQHMNNEKFYVRGNANDVHNLFTGLLRCSKCGSKLSVSSQTHRTKRIKIRHAICQRKRMLKECDLPSVRLEYLEQRILHCLTKELVVSDVLIDDKVSQDLIRTVDEADGLMQCISSLNGKAEALAGNMADMDLSVASRKRLVAQMNGIEAEIGVLQKDYNRLMARATSLQAFYGSAKSSLAEVKALVVDTTDSERPDGETLQSQWAKIEACKHPSQVLKATDRAMLRTAIATLVDAVIIQTDGSAEILFKTGIKRHVTILKYVDVGWGKVAQVVP